MRFKIRRRKWDRIQKYSRESLDGKGGRWKIKETFCEGREAGNGGGGGACHIFYFAETYEAGLIG